MSSVSRNDIITAASRNQHDAASPAQSVWVSANAGTGKTRVLTDRILRLLVDGAAVTDILAVTYTRAAAAEMRNRLYDRLARWAVGDETTLSAEIQNMGVEQPSQKQIDRGRRLFAELLDAPVAIRIETVHAFAQSVLRRFPVEANIQPYFDLATETQSRQLKDEAVADVMGSADGLVMRSLRHLAQTISEDHMVSFAAKMFDHPLLLRRVDDDPAKVRGELSVALGCGGEVDDPAAAISTLLTAAVATDASLSVRLKSFAMASIEGAASDVGRGETLVKFLAADKAERLLMFDDYAEVFLTKSGEPRKTTATKKVMAESSDFPHLIAEQTQMLQTVKKKINSIETAHLSMAIYVVAAQMAVGYNRRKINAGLMDYDDLISKTVDLFAQDGGVSWVRYKLDKGIKHLLIDEAQDTSPNQWKVLSSLAEEFFNEGAQDDDTARPARSLFSVGDYKQSIYSFQGARPDLFHDQEEKFTELAKHNKKPFKRVNLDTSFRTTKPILELVDRVARDENEANGFLAGLGEAAAHQVSRIGDAGFVEMLDVVKSDGDDDFKPFTPYRGEDTTSPEILLARKIVDTLRAWIGCRNLPARGRAMRAGDVLILLRRRRGFGVILDREIRRAGLPLAGADRVMLKDDIAVMDLMALGQVMLLPEDDLSLATVLKSPLFGLSEDDIFILAHDRGKDSLVRRLAEKAAEEERFDAAHEKFNAWLGRAETSTPYEFYRAVLGSETRQSFTRRMGQPVLDIIDEFLKVARDYESIHPPSMQGFLAMLATSEIEITREGTAKDADEIRIMTIHGAKGLESPVVILPDTLTQSKGGRSNLVELDHQGVIYPIKPISGGILCDAVSHAKTRERQAEEHESNRLLYVGLTRAEDGVLVAGFESSTKRKLDGSWYQHIRNALESMHGCVPRPDGDGIMVTADQTADIKPEDDKTITKETHPIPPWLSATAPEEEAPPRPLTPSSFGGDYTGLSPSGQARQQAMLRGSLTHRLLEILPGLDGDGQRRAIARIAAPYIPRHLDAETCQRAAQETLTLINNDRLAGLFGAGSRAEVPLSGLVGGHVVSGIIDRMVVTDATITIVDFKTGAPPKGNDDIPQHYIRQLSLYAQVLRQIWPERDIVAGLIYTEDASVYWINRYDLDASYQAF
jgi:ATP-dependent helicase/nuclease subunit A